MGALTLPQFEEVLKQSRQFVINPKMATDYFRMIDVDGDNLVSF